MAVQLAWQISPSDVWFCRSNVVTAQTPATMPWVGASIISLRRSVFSYWTIGKRWQEISLTALGSSVCSSLLFLGSRTSNISGVGAVALEEVPLSWVLLFQPAAAAIVVGCR